jgi:hypothetical protein
MRRIAEMSMLPTKSSLVLRIRAAAVHLIVSGLVAVAVALVVFFVWYPGPFREMAGGQGLFLLIVSVDVVLGPLLTLVAFNPAKRRAELRRDLAVIATLQMAALAYGVFTVWEVRPVAIVYETDRYRVISAGEVRTKELPLALRQFQRLPWTGPWELGVRSAAEGAERNEAIFLSFEGFDTSQRPQFWRPYNEFSATAYQRARPVSVLLDHHSQKRAALKQKLGDAGAEIQTCRFVPVRARGDWVAILAPGGRIATYLPVDGFF